MNLILPYLNLIGPYLPYVMAASGLLLALLLAVKLARHIQKSTPAESAGKPAQDSVKDFEQGSPLGVSAHNSKDEIKADPIAVAQHEADRIIQEAREQAHQIVANTQAFKQEVDLDAKHTLEEAVSHDSKNLREEVAAIETQYKEFLDRLQSKYFADVEKSLQEGRLSVDKYLQKKIDEEFARAKRQIDEYREMQIKKIEDLTVPTVTRISKEVLGKSFSPQEHEEIIVQTLEKAKREGMFDF